MTQRERRTKRKTKRKEDTAVQQWPVERIQQPVAVDYTTELKQGAAAGEDSEKKREEGWKSEKRERDDRSVRESLRHRAWPLGTERGVEEETCERSGCVERWRAEERGCRGRAAEEEMQLIEE